MPVEEEGEPEESRGEERGPDLRSMSRYGGGGDVYARRRLLAALAVVAVLILLFILLGGC